MALKLNAEDIVKMTELPLHELDYCLKLIKRFELLSIDEDVACRAVSSMLERGIRVA